MKDRHRDFVVEKKKSVKTKPCLNCQKLFTSLHPTKKYCCKGCKSEREEIVFREKLAAEFINQFHADRITAEKDTGLDAG